MIERARRLIRRRHEKDAIEPAGTAESGIEVPRSVGRAEDEQAVVAADVAIHLGEELIDQGAAGAAPEIVAVGSERIDLIEEKHRRRMIAGEFEKRVQIFLRVAEVEIEDLVDADGEKAGLDLARGGAAEQRLAASGRAVEQHAAADLFAVGLEELRIFQRMNDLHPDLFLDRLHAADVGEGQLWPLRSLASTARLFAFFALRMSSPAQSLFPELLLAVRAGCSARRAPARARDRTAGIEFQCAVVVRVRRRPVSFASVQPREEEMCRREIRMLPRAAPSMRTTASLVLPLRCRIRAMPSLASGRLWLEAEDAVESAARFLQRPLVEAGLGEQQEQGNVFGRNGDSLAEGISLDMARVEAGK